MQIGVLCPSRSNPSGLMRAYRSMLDTSEAATMIACLDLDQKNHYELPQERMLSCYGEPGRDIVAAVNLGVAQHPGFDVYGLIVDDARFTVPGWDRYAAETIESFPGRLGVLSAAHPAGRFVNFGYVSREWINLVGWYACPDVAHFCWDTALELLGDATRIEYAPPDRFEINHDLTRDEKTLRVFYRDTVKFLGWVVNDRRRIIQKIRARTA